MVGKVTGNEDAGGGSPITQQYVKNTLVGNEYSYVRKIRELIYSVKMTNEWDKEDILNAYLNTVYFGRNAYGIRRHPMPTLIRTPRTSLRRKAPCSPVSFSPRPASTRV